MLERWRVSVQSEAIQKACSDIDVFAKRAADAATSLYKLSDATTTRGVDQSCWDLANALFAFNGVLFHLKSLWTAIDMLVTTPCECYWLSGVLKNNFANVLRGIESTIEQARHPLDSNGRRGGQTYGGSDTSVQHAKSSWKQDLDKHTLFVTGIAIKEREAALSRQTATNDETVESLHLQVVVKCADRLDESGCLKPTMKEECCRITNTPPPSDSSVQSCTSSAISLPQYKSQPVTLPHHSAPPNYTDTQHQREAVMATGSEKNKKKTETPQDKPAPKPENKLISKPNKDAADMRNAGKRLEELSIEPATVGARAVDPRPAVVAIDSKSAKEEKSSSNPWMDFVSRNVAEHHETYVLRPHVETFGGNVIWTSKVEPLSVDEAAIRAHLMKLGSGYSIIDAIDELLPEQLVLVQKQAKSRNGRLVSVQYSAPADMVTTMGTFKVKPVIFIIVTSAGDGDASVGTKTEVKALDVKPPANPFASPQIFQPQPDCNRNEREEHFMTITSKQDYGPNPPSLEELRVRDYAVGKTGPLFLNSDSSHLFGDKNPFGEHYTNPRASSSTPTASQPTTTARQNVFRIIKQPSSGSQSVALTNQGLFGGLLFAPSSSSLFGKPAAPMSLFSGNKIGNNAATPDDGGSSPPKLGFRPQSVAPTGNGLFGGASVGPSLSLFGNTASIGPFATTPKDLGTGLFGTPSQPQRPVLFGNFGRPQPTQPSLFNTPEYLAIAQPAITPNSTSLFGDFTNATTLKGSGTGLSSTPSQTQPSSGHWAMRKHWPSQQSSGNTSKEPANGQLGTTSSSAGVFGDFTRSRPMAKGLANLPTSSGKLEDTRTRKCKECTSYVSGTFSDEPNPNAVLCDECKAKKETPCWLCDKSDQKDDNKPQITANPTVPAPEEKEDKLLASTSPAPTPAVESATPNSPAATEEPDLPSTGNSELDLQTHENVFLPTITRHFFVDEKGATWRQLGPELPTAPPSTSAPFVFGPSKQEVLKKESEPCKHRNVFDKICRDCGKGC